MVIADTVKAVRWVISMSASTSVIKERADEIRASLDKVSDLDLVSAQSETFGAGFITLAEHIVKLAEKAQRETPF